MTPQEEADLQSRYQQSLRDTETRELQAAASLIERFRQRVADKGIRPKDVDFRYSHTTGITACHPRLLRALLDVDPDPHDGLYRWSDLKAALRPAKFDGGCLQGDGIVVLAHPCFRRAMHPLNNWAPLFIDIFWRLEQPGLDKYVALDDDRVRIDVDGPMLVELDTWYGPRFNPDIVRIAAGMTKLRPPADLDAQRIAFWYADAYCVDVKWTDGPVRTFQALELKSESVQLEVNGENLHPARYLHAEFDARAGSFRHFDGAIQYLSDDEHSLRKDSDFNLIYKNQLHVKPKSRKVFKINGSLDVHTWVELASHFYASNPLMYEYFNRGEPPPHVADLLNRLRAPAPR
jgi:hypothetical protein